MIRRLYTGAAALAMIPALAACTAANDSTIASTPAPAATVYAQASKPQAGEVDILALVSQMSLERKIAQLIQPQINSFTPEDMERYRFGSYLNGGNGGPYGDEFAPASQWLRYADEMYEASVKPLPNGEPVIPTMWGTDAVHGHTNVPRATIFPHNIGLGATRDADLVRRIGGATAVEIEVTGIDWNFSPTVAVARDDRWGRTYESYSEDPQLVAEMGVALVEGLQGRLTDDQFLGDGHVIATAKHFFGDGGTDQGVDQGEVNGDIDELKSIHAVPYPAAIGAGVETIMASFNSINGKKMHGNRALLTDVLRDEMGFDGLVVGDWNGHGQIAGCTVTNCPQSLMAGLDIYMVPDEWKGLLETLVRQVEDGTIPMARVDEAVGRVLRMKARAGILGPNARKPSDRANAGDMTKLGSAEHRAIAREAVAKSQIILTNNGVLPLKDGANVLVAGSAADSIAQAAGGWTLTWQGGGELTNANFPGATSIWGGLKTAVEGTGGTARLSADGTYKGKPDVAIVVFGEKPYAEFSGDQKDLVMRDEEGLNLLRKFRTEGVPTVAVFLSGRPMWMNREINLADAFVASWLPGSEGAGVADVLTGARDATGKLSFSWPVRCEGMPLNGPEGALFAFGYGRSLSDTKALPELPEDCAALDRGDQGGYFASGRLAPGVTAYALPAGGGSIALPQFRNLSGEGGVVVRGIDRNAQEDAREITMQPGTGFATTGPDDSNRAFRIVYQLTERPTAPVMLNIGTSTNDRAQIDVTQGLSVAAGKGWREMVITQTCAPGMGNQIALRSEGLLTMRVASIVREELPADAECSF